MRPASARVRFPSAHMSPTWGGSRPRLTSCSLPALLSSHSVYFVFYLPVSSKFDPKVDLSGSGD